MAARGHIHPRWAFARLRPGVVWHLRNDPSDDIGEFGGHARYRMALPDFITDFREALVQIHIGRNDGAGPLGIFTKGFSHCIFNASHAGAFQPAVDIDADDSGVAHYDAMRALDARHSFYQLFQINLSIPI